MRTIILLAGIALLLASCDARTERTTVDLSKMTYERDARTGECFAVIGHTEGGNLISNTNGFTITWVPCDPKVETAIQEDSR